MTDREPETMQWVHAARGGDEKAFGLLFEHLAPALYTWADLRLRGNQRAHVDPSDVVQEVWLRAWKGLDGYDPVTTPFRPWIFRVAKNVLLEAGRQVSRQRQAGGLGPTTRMFALENLPDDATAVSRRLVRDEGLSSFIDGVRDLPEEDRKLVVHCGLEGLPRREVATRLGLSTEAVTKRWQRLRARLEEAGMPEQLSLDPV